MVFSRRKEYAALLSPHLFLILLFRTGAIVGVVSCLAWSPLTWGQGIPVYGYEVHNTYPHDPKAFTQGLFYLDGFLYESTGMVGESTIRKVEPSTGSVIQSKPLPGQRFGEGITRWKDQVYMLTWKSQVGFVWDIETFALKRRFSYQGEGWGLTSNNDSIIMSNGTPVVTFLEPDSLAEQRRITVNLGGRPVANVNELEWVNGEILANLWQSQYIARINPADGEITGLIDLGGLLTPADVAGRKIDVLNGIATDDEGRLFVTGKYWPKLFLISPTEEPVRYLKQ
ncbi:MAG: glutaminyl-peptide cyclotransferase [Lysobacterales bacterium]